MNSQDDAFFKAHTENFLLPFIEGIQEAESYDFGIMMLSETEIQLLRDLISKISGHEA